MVFLRTGCCHAYRVCGFRDDIFTDVTIHLACIGGAVSLTKLADGPLSIGYYSPGWPLDAFPNGVVSYVSDLYLCLKALGHEVTVVAVCAHAQKWSNDGGVRRIGLWCRISW
jgi:hypothetical protein